jgi:hypothetical protein
MPFKSLAQEGWAHTHPEEFGKKNLAEFDAATKGKHLPEHVKKYHNGVDVVPHDTLALLQKGEAVIPKKDNSMAMNPYEKITSGDKKPKKEIKEMVHTKTHNGKHIVTHKHHHPEHHPDETHALEDMSALHDHIEDHAGTPNEGETSDAGAGAPAQLTASPSPAAAAAGAGAPPMGM